MELHFFFFNSISIQYYELTLYSIILLHFSVNTDGFEEAVDQVYVDFFS